MLPKKAILKQEFQQMNINLPESLEIVGEGKHVEISTCGNSVKTTEEDVYITNDMRNYPKDRIDEYYNFIY